MSTAKGKSVTAESAREFLRQSAELSKWTTDYAQKIFAVDAATARKALDVLAATGYIEPVGKSTKEWRNTTAGDAAVGVSEARPVKRSTAEGKLKELLERVDQVDKDTRFLFRVARVVVFGPYLAKNAAIKDIDVAVELQQKEGDTARHEKLAAEHIEAAEAEGKKFKNHAARRDFPRTEVLDFLKSRSRTIALRELDDWVLNQPHKVVR